MSFILFEYINSGVFNFIFLLIFSLICSVRKKMLSSSGTAHTASMFVDYPSNCVVDTGCKKRAYCPKECQRAGWSIKGDGQRHVNWCRRHECGEEDVDWEVVSIGNKGLGIRAKKLIPAGLKIIVEPVCSSPNDHPGSSFFKCYNSFSYIF